MRKKSGGHPGCRGVLRSDITWELAGVRVAACNRTLNSSLGTTKSGPVGRTVSAQLAPSPLWDSSSARDAVSRSAKSISNARLSTAALALRCHPRRDLRELWKAFARASCAAAALGCPEETELDAFNPGGTVGAP